MEKKIPELLAPAGDITRLKVAILYGANAVYLGGKEYSLRAKATNFSDDEIIKATNYAHNLNVKVYVTVNIFAHNKDFKNLHKHLYTLQKASVDGVIVSDPGIISIIKKEFPNLKIHLSTQANVTNKFSAKFWEDLGISRINLARELSIQEIREIREFVKCELEMFVHGALCIAYSGRCFLSLYMTGRNANKGECAQPCRYHYRLEEAKRKGQFFPIEEDHRGSYIFNSKELCLLKRLPEIINAKVDSIKIEGRMRSHFYIASVVRLYRNALDYIKNSNLDLNNISLPEHFFYELNNVGTRGYTENFFNGSISSNDMLYDKDKIENRYVFAGYVIDHINELTKIQTKFRFKVDDELELLNMDLTCKKIKVTKIFNENGDKIDVAQTETIVLILTDPPILDSKPYQILRKKNPDYKETD